jgi:hypothetical protein
MSDADFAEAVLRSLEKLDTACLDFIDADTAKPHDLQIVRQRFRDLNASIVELLSHDLLQLDALAMKVLQSSPGKWASRFREELTGGQATNVEDLHRHVRRRHPSLFNLAKLLRGQPKDAKQQPASGAAIAGLGQPPAVQRAWAQYQGAVQARPDLEGHGTDREVYDFVKHTCMTDNDGIQLPAFNTWQRYLRSARRALNCRKHQPRYGRPHGSSIVHQNQIETGSEPDF